MLKFLAKERDKRKTADPMSLQLTVILMTPSAAHQLFCGGV